MFGVILVQFYYLVCFRHEILKTITGKKYVEVNVRSEDLILP